MSRRGNNEGSITRLPDGRWQARITLANGKRKAFYAPTRQEAARLLAAAIRDRDRGLPVAPERQTVEQFLKAWLEAIKGSVRPKTHRSYSDYCRLHIVPDLGKIPVAKLAPQQLLALYSRKLKEGLSPTTVRHLHSTLHRALEQGVRWGVVLRNVADLVDPPRRSRQEMKVLSPEQARLFLEAAQGDRLEALYVLALTTGMRQGELLGLRWQDVDLDGGRLHVRAIMQRTGDGLGLREPKTASSRRQIALTGMAVAALKRHRARQLEERLAAGPEWEDNDLVFCNAHGRPIEATNLLKRSFKPLLEKAGLPDIRFHDLRHSAATLLLKQRVPGKVVSEMLGHSQVGVTLNIYSHVLPDMQAEAAAAMQNLLG